MQNCGLTVQLTQCLKGNSLNIDNVVFLLHDILDRTSQFVA